MQSCTIFLLRSAVRSFPSVRSCVRACVLCVVFCLEFLCCAQWGVHLWILLSLAVKKRTRTAGSEEGDCIDDDDNDDSEDDELEGAGFFTTQPPEAGVGSRRRSSSKGDDGNTQAEKEQGAASEEACVPLNLLCQPLPRSNRAKLTAAAAVV